MRYTNFIVRVSIAVLFAGATALMLAGCSLLQPAAVTPARAELNEQAIQNMIRAEAASRANPGDAILRNDAVVAMQNAKVISQELTDAVTANVEFSKKMEVWAQTMKDIGAAQPGTPWGVILGSAGSLLAGFAAWRVRPRLLPIAQSTGVVSTDAPPPTPIPSAIPVLPVKVV